MDRCEGCFDWQDWVELIKSSTANGILYATAIVSFVEVGRMVLLPADYLRQKFIVSLLRDYVRLNAKGKCPPRNLLCYQTTIWSTSVEMAT